MPELPEVETVARLLRPRVEGRRIARVRASWRRTVGNVSPARLTRELAGLAIARLWRRGKFLVFDLEGEEEGFLEGWLVGHLRMSGRMRVAEPKEPADRWTRAALEFEGGGELRFIDVRKFGRLVFARDLEPHLGGLGPEPLGPEFTAQRFARNLAARRRALKPLLLDQTFIAGLGNIYVDEALFAARLHPLTPAHRVRGERARRLHAAIVRTLRAAIDREGSSFDAFYRTPEGNPGRYQDRFGVYGRAGRPCRRCGGEIRRIVVGQRGTHLCPRCQRPPRRLESAPR